MHKLTVQTSSRSDFVNITGAVQEGVQKLGIEEGCVTVFVPHTTAGITLNENADPDVVSDMKQVLDNLVPWNGPYQHGEGNTAAHVKASLIGSSCQIIVEGGHLQLGTWQGLFLCEFDGPRSRRVWVSG